jgi:hypothetical protein
MNALQRLQAVAGQKIHEQMYGATLHIFDVDIPCTHTEIINDFELVPGGKSPTTFIMAITFRADQIPDKFTPSKGILCILTINADLDPLELQLWDGGLMPGGFIYIFRAVDKNYHA